MFGHTVTWPVIILRLALDECNVQQALVSVVLVGVVSFLE